MRQLFSLMFLGFALTSAGYAEASCSPRHDEFDDRFGCERRHSRCDYDSRLGCYVPANGGGWGGSDRCERRNDEYSSQNECERQHRFCEYNSRLGCYTPGSESGRCERRNQEYNDRSDCERRHNSCEYNSRIGCYVPERGGGGGGWRPTTTTTTSTTTTTTRPMPSCPWTDDDGSYQGRGRRGFRNQAVCEHAERGNHATCEQRGDGCWHPIGQ